MPKIRLKAADEYQFKYERTAVVGDINYGNHVSNDALVRIVHEARCHLFNEMGFSELNLGDGKTGIIMGDLAVNYLAQGRMFDKLLVESAVTEIKSASFRIVSRISRDKTVLALVETGIITFDYRNETISKVPGEFLDKLPGRN
jgi:acyl-CoA thioester hydrolase